MRVLFVVHQEDAGPGVFADEAAERGWEPTEWRPPSDEPPPEAFDAVITFGGGMHVDQEDRHPWLRTEKGFLRELLERGVPTFGVCLGGQLVAEAAGAKVGKAERPEIGWHAVRLEEHARDDPLLRGFPGTFHAMQWHSYQFANPPRATALAVNGVGPQAYRVGESAWGIQFHAEVTAASVASWIERYKGDDDVREAGVDLEAVARETEERIGDWNAFGRTLCGRFLDFAQPR